MIAKTDLFILVVSSSLLAAGVYRWQSNLSLMANTAQQARNTTIQAPAINQGSTSVVSAIANNNSVTRTTITSVTGVQTSTSNNAATAPQVVVSSSGSGGSINASKPVEPVVSAPSAVENRPLYGTYTVVSGDYLSKIAQRYGTTVRTLQDINGISGSRIDVGQKLQYPLPAN